MLEGPTPAPESEPAPAHERRIDILERRLAKLADLLQAREDELVLKLNDCFVKDRAEGTVCGLSSNEAPHPWLALNGVKCRGYDTLSTREGDYCGYCIALAIQTDTGCQLRAHACRSALRRGKRHQPNGGRDQEGAPAAALGGPLLHDGSRRR